MTSIADYNNLPMDDFYTLMASHTISWGDLCMDYVAPVSSAEAEPTTPKDDEPVRDMEFCWEYDVPTLNKRKDIWENFPVSLIPLGAGPDGAERHAIVWHRKNYEEWRQTRSRDFDEWMDYDIITPHLLFKALGASKYWTVEDSTADGQVAVIRMNFVSKDETAGTEVILPTVTLAAAEPTTVVVGEDDSVDAWVLPAAPKKAVVAPKAKPSGLPVLTRLNHIKENFPVVWHVVTDAPTRTAIYGVELFGKMVPRGQEAAIKATLLAALRASSAWRVLAPAAGTREVCRLEMA